MQEYLALNKTLDALQAELMLVQKGGDDAELRMNGVLKLLWKCIDAHMSMSSIAQRVVHTGHISDTIIM